MKKKIWLFLISFTISITSINTTSCFLFGKKDKGETTNDLDGIKDKIESDNNILAKGANLDSDSSNELTKKTILNDIGLNAEEQEFVSSLTGTLIENNAEKITFNLEDSSTTETVDQNVTWWKDCQDPIVSEINLSEAILLKDNHILVGGDSGGLYESDDNGHSFFLLSNWFNSYPHLLISKLYQASNGDIYVGTSYDGAYKSTDEYSNFEELSSANIYEYDSVKSIYQTSNQDIYIGTDSHLYKSDNNGNHFSILNFSSSHYNSIMQTSENDYIYVGCKSLYQSTDNGVNFSRTSNDIPLDKNIFCIMETSNGDIYMFHLNIYYIDQLIVEKVSQN